MVWYHKFKNPDYTSFIIESVRQRMEREKREIDKSTPLELGLQAVNAQPIAEEAEISVRFYDLSVACGRPNSTMSAVLEPIALQCYSVTVKNRSIQPG